MKNRFHGTKGVILVVILILLVLSYYYHLSNKTNNGKNEEVVGITAAQEILLRNYDTNYPPTPKEVLKEYLQISKVLHNEDLTDDEVTGIGIKIQDLYDAEFVANKSQDEYLKDLKSEVATFRDNDYAITNYYTSASTDVIYDKVDGFDFAKLYATYSVRAGGKTQTLREVFLLRKDDVGHWKIYGWEPVTDSEDDSNE
ncbi:MAG: hypothetical protein K6G69_06560 [Lachnospiraceae bacterium]|nr:hypothetical protein [Lachnospiraceae bacterium]